MANYSDIKGFTVQTLSSDPAASTAATGSWASGGTINNARDLLGGAGPQTSALIFGGQPYPGSSAYTESYDGSSWTEVADLNTARILLGGLGTSNTAVLAFGGNLSPPNYRADTESWNGSAWTEVNDLNDGRWAMAGNAGTQTAGLLFGGGPGEVPSSDAHTESWNGTSWSNEPDMNTAREENAGAGTSTSALSIGGTPSYPTATAVVEQWNGSGWTEITDINTARNDLGGLKGGGTVTDTLVFGGLNRATPATYAITEFWNGSAWTELSDLSTARYGGSGSGTSSAALYAAGNSGSITGVTEEWTTAPPATFSKITEGQLYFNSTTNTFKETITDIPGTSWASGGNLNTARQGGGSAGIQTAALCTGGGNPTAVAITEQYNGSAWTEVNDLNSGRKTSWTGLGLSYSAAIFSSGSQPPGTTRVTNNESWDGTNWTEVNNVNTARNNGASSGSSTSGIGSGGYNAPSYTGATEIWDGTNWTETTDLNTPRYSCTGAGQSSSSALNIAGYSTAVLAVVEQWNGSSWTEVGDLNTARYGGGASVAGPVDSVLYFGGDVTGPGVAQTEFWNGTSWTELNDLSTARIEIFGAGTGGASALAYGGYATTVVTNVTEEWTAGLANKTITTS